MAVEDNGVIKIILLLIIFNHFDLTLITNLLKASELKEDGSAEEGGMIKVRLMSLIYKTMKINIQFINMITLILLTLT